MVALAPPPAPLRRTQPTMPHLLPLLPLAMPAPATPPAPAAVICTVDVVLLTLHQHSLHVLLQARERAPAAGALALPGGYIHTDQDRSAWHAAERVLAEKTGIHSPYLEQLATWSGPARDPRGWSLSVVYYALVHQALVQPRPGVNWQLCPVDQLPALPFDHADIVALARERVRTKSQYSSLPVFLCDEVFTLPQLQAVYEAVLGEPINKVSFRRKIDELAMLEPVTGQRDSSGAHRPAQLWRLLPAFRRALSLSERGLNPRGGS